MRRSSWFGELVSPGPDAHDHVTERPQLRRQLLRRARLVEERAEPDRRLRVAHLLEQRQLERALHRNDSAIVHA
jgi:hypothetical protein